MNYKTFEKNEDTFFKYLPKKVKNVSIPTKKNRDNPFDILKQINFK